MEPTLKAASYAFCQRYVAERMERITTAIAALKEALQTETKSTAGDKHETGRAMVQLKREQLGQQLAEATALQALVHKIPQQTSTEKVVLGSLVKTTTATYYIGISAGLFKTAATPVYCISAASPIGRLLLGKSVGNRFSFNGKTNRVLKII